MGIFLVNYDYSTIQHIVQAMLPFQLEDRDRHPEDGFNSPVLAIALCLDRLLSRDT